MFISSTAMAIGKPETFIMDKAFKYYIFRDKKLMVEILSGYHENFVDKYIGLKQQETEHPDFNPNFNIIVDLRNLTMVNFHEIKPLISLYLEKAKNVPGIIGKRKSALLTSSPDQVVATTIYRTLNDLPIEMEIFSTYEAALKWLDVDEIDGEIFG